MALAIPDAQFEAKVDEVTEGVDPAQQAAVRTLVKAARDAEAAVSNALALQDPAAIVFVNEKYIDLARDMEAQYKA